MAKIQSFIIILNAFFLLPYYFVCSEQELYNRSKVQEIYPGFGTEFILFPDENNEPIFGYLNLKNGTRILGIHEKINYDEEIKFEFFSRQYPDGLLVKSKDELKMYVNNTKPTKFVTHGWMSGGNKDSSVLIRNGFLYRYDANIFVMDWSAISGNIFYPIPMLATSDVGKYYGEFLNYLVDELKIEPKDIHLVGHSLGAHVSGFAGRCVKKGKIGRITGLDPALPGFDIGLVSSGRLNLNDANFVDIIHTCAGYLGYKDPLGHADFYPNGGGPPQPGCGILEFIEVCSHGRSWKIFASSLNREDQYPAIKCSTAEEAHKNSCKGDSIPIGDKTPNSARGIYYSDILEKDLMISIDENNKIE